MQINTVPITPTPATIDPILEPPLRSSSPTIRRLLPCYPRRQINNDDLIASIDQVGQKLIDCLSIAESALTTLVQRRPPSDLDLSEADQETLGVMALPFGLTSIAATYQDALRGKFADQVGDIYPLADQLSCDCQHAAHRPIPQSIPPNHPRGKSRLRVLGLYGDYRRNHRRTTSFPSLP